MALKHTTASKHIEQLTWLRGLAAFLVIVSHALRINGVNYLMSYRDAPVPVLSLLDMGYFGVALFFALSGCTLFISNADKITNFKSILGFYIKRFFRIWPAYIVSLAVYMAFAPVFRALFGDSHGTWFGHQYYRVYSISDVFHYVFLISNITGPDELFNNAYWSLPIEFQYYLLLPLLILSMRVLGIAGPLLIGLFIYYIPGVSYIGRGFEFFNMAFIFCGGAVLGYMHTKINKRIPKKYAIGGFILSMGGAIVLNQYHSMPIELQGFYKTLWVWQGAFALLVTFTVLTSHIRFPSRVESFLRTYGEISYSTYLYHGLLLSIAAIIMMRVGVSDDWATRIWFSLFFALVGVYVVAKLSHRYIEMPSNKYGHIFADRFSRKK